jgi:hypothetical protein
MKHILGILLVSSMSPAMAQTTFVCGNVACSPFATTGPGITGIDDLSVKGVLFDVAFKVDAISTPFAFSYRASSPGQQITGVDAGNALDAFYATQSNGNPGDEGPLTNVLVTAYKVAANGQVEADFVNPFLGYHEKPTTVAADAGDNQVGSTSVVVGHGSSINWIVNSYTTQTVWTAVPPIKAPELEPSSLTGALTILFAGIAVYRGRRADLIRATPRVGPLDPS